MFQDKLAGRSPQGRGEEVREGEAEFPLFASAWSQALPPQTPGMPARIINQQQEACGYMFVAELVFETVVPVSQIKQGERVRQ